MNDRMRVTIADRIALNKTKLEELDIEFHRACCPKGIPSGTSYEDYDLVHGSKKEFRLEDYYKARKRLEAFISLDEQISESLYESIKDEEYLDLLDNNEQKVAYCRLVKGYTQAKTSQLIGISERQVQRLEKII